MAERLKDMFFTKESIKVLAEVLKENYLQFDEAEFQELVFNPQWDSLELKEKMHHIASCLRKALPPDYKKAIDILIKTAPKIEGFDGMAIPDFVEQFGLDDWHSSLPALKQFTKYSSSEFAIRPFLLEDLNRTMVFMNEAADDENENIRRFASEGCRPTLPWAMAIPELKKDPGLIIPILEKLKDDKSEFVRKSAANNLNDISKDHPDLVLKLCKAWQGKSKRTDWIIKHACRTMLKAGNKRALILFGFGDTKNMKIKNLELKQNTIKIGDELSFSFELETAGRGQIKLRLEYKIEFMKAKGRKSAKVFQISENIFKPGTYKFSKRQSFADMTTRRHYRGSHKIIILVNGDEMLESEFEVVN